MWVMSDTATRNSRPYSPELMHTHASRAPGATCMQLNQGVSSGLVLAHSAVKRLTSSVTKWPNLAGCGCPGPGRMCTWCSLEKAAVPEHGCLGHWGCPTGHERSGIRWHSQRPAKQGTGLARCSLVCVAVATGTVFTRLVCHAGCHISTSNSS